MPGTTKHSNQLIHESSPYLLQHAHNPVDWFPWNDKALAKAQTENKLLLISIGYSACHWCHVMEHECFESEEVAKVMNEHFICIKVDREERPDIDQVYMNAVQLMTGSGGWPLNCLALPDGKPIYGGTYFPKDRWIAILNRIVELRKNDYPKLLEYADKLTQGIKQSELIAPNKSKVDFDLTQLDDLYYNWSKQFDHLEGGPDRAPKFPMPNNYQFLLRYAVLTKNKEAADFVHLTLSKMAFGGIYDHLGGGFARYSVDNLWKVPHFEKMLYDNAQLISLYAEAYHAFKNPLYKKVVFECIAFVENELHAAEGGFYAALDADSEGVEGKFYCWTKVELKELLGADFDLFAAVYSINEHGYWEEERYILLRKEAFSTIASRHKITEENLHQLLDRCKGKLNQERAKRIKPGLDDKILCSWNCLMIKALCDAYRVFGEDEFLQKAIKGMQFISTSLYQNGQLFHSYKNGTAKINGFLEDYAFCIEACIALYEVSFDESYLLQAKELLDYSLRHFSDNESDFLFFTSDADAPLIARKMETSDNVIPASNSSIAKSLFWLGHIFDVPDYLEKSAQMLHQVKHLMIHYGSGYSNWAQLQLMHTLPFYEIAICGKDAEKLRAAFEQKYVPNKVMLGGIKASELPLLQQKWSADKTLIYVCLNKSCKLPVEQADEAFQQLTEH